MCVCACVECVCVCMCKKRLTWWIISCLCDSELGRMPAGHPETVWSASLCWPSLTVIYQSGFYSHFQKPRGETMIIPRSVLSPCYRVKTRQL